ncbi:hypothetical protein HQ865_14905 [Mucilaginibacter mali]|uniref:Uncharacterized protein n=1 Tax=Mucilaginibacter mali TaxID=2740462 RepID=A0A7D4Q228_9SPHI|nr:hypothetical protein [Mucilaginibacter mali]QKJ30986.1 hypothetical protein HQ865_14905 [Mucilaginibacter mali]
MKRTIIIAFIFIAILLLIDYFASQKVPVASVAKKHQKTEYVPLKREQSKDTLVVRGEQMVFFMPTQKEFDAMVEKEGEDSGANEMMGDFDEYMSQVIDSLKKNPWLKTTITHKQVVTVVLANGRKVNIDCTKDDNIVGSILCDGNKEPQVDYGVSTSDDYWAMIDNYYGQKQKHDQ